MAHHSFMYDAEVAELADAHDSKSCSARSVGSTPTFGTIIVFPFYDLKIVEKHVSNWKKICIATRS